ncbi:MAG TPA: CPBP family intramembrane glutamic endopeptidase [Armatimonadota bacterium]|nr:CPBP family intramembrane glutamic endopeptidase [Armatimonadota bacterium]
MWVILYLVAILALLLFMQTLVLLAFREPLQWTFGANSQQPKSLKLALKIVLQSTLIGSIFLFPYLVGKTPGSYYGPMFPLEKIHYFLYGEVIALLLLGIIFAVELAGGWIFYKPRWPAKKAWSKSLFSALSSLTVVSVEEPFFRGIILYNMLPAGWIALPLSAVLFSAAHYIRKLKNYWPSIGLAVLGLWMGVAFIKTGTLWLPMGLHSGGILAIGVHRCFLNYKGPPWLIGTQTFPIAGAISITIMLIGTAVTWFMFSGG